MFSLGKGFWKKSNYLKTMGMFTAFVFLLSSFLFGFNPAQAQAAQVLWAYDYGSNGAETAGFVQQTKDDGYILAGHVYPTGQANSEIYLMKTDIYGKMQWQKSYDAKRHRNTGATAIVESSDGSFVLAGYSRTRMQSDILLMKTDAKGEIKWQKSIGGANSSEEPMFIQQTKDGNFILCGYKETDGNKDACLIKLNANGGVIWQKTYGGSGEDIANSVQECSDGGYILTGASERGSRKSDLVLIKTDKSGKLLWQKTYGGSGRDSGKSVRQTADAGFITAGYKSSEISGGLEVYLLKTDAQGNLSWEKTFTASSKNTAAAVEECSDGGYIVLANTYSYGSNLYGAYIIKTDASGNKIMENVLGKEGPDFVAWGQSTKDAAFVVAGTKNVTDPQGDNAFLLKYNLLAEAEKSEAKIEQQEKKQQKQQNYAAAKKGEIIWPDLSEYRGDIVQGKANGWGRIVFSDGGRYEGNWQNNLFNGQGCLTTPYGEKYEGNFRDNMFDGYGVYRWSSGEKYEGEFKFNRFNGEGNFTWPDGVVYKGDFRDGEAHGYGSITWPNGEKYIGQMKNGQADGMGTYTFSNGEEYTGQFSGLTFEGLGTYSWPDGSQYVGEFAGDMMSGQGTFTWSNGVQQWGYWQEDRFIGLYPEEQ